MQTQVNGAVEERPRQKRRGRKRLKFAPPGRFPRGVRELWTSATAQEQEKAHTTCTRILAMWLGRMPAAEVASELAIPRLRVWQLSQQALSGMLAGLLHQPRTRRGRPKEGSMDGEIEDRSSLKKQLAEKDKKLAEQDELIRLLIGLPKIGSESPKSDGPTTAAAKTRARKSAAKPEEEARALAEKAPPAAR
jgi:hypothetical protein